MFSWCLYPHDYKLCCSVEGDRNGKVVEVRTNLTVEMLEGGVLQPYTFCRVDISVIFSTFFSALPFISQENGLSNYKSDMDSFFILV